MSFISNAVDTLSQSIGRAIGTLHGGHIGGFVGNLVGDIVGDVLGKHVDNVAVALFGEGVNDVAALFANNYTAALHHGLRY